MNNIGSSHVKQIKLSQLQFYKVFLSVATINFSSNVNKLGTSTSTNHSFVTNNKKILTIQEIIYPIQYADNIYEPLVPIIKEVER